MKLNRAFHSCFLISALTLGALACGGGGGGGESFIVSGLWSVNGTASPGTASPASDVCNAAAAGAGPLPATVINVVRQDGTVTATEQGAGGLTFIGTVNDANQSFTLDSTQICVAIGACVVCGAFGVDFLNAAGNTADVNFVFVATGNSACPAQCTVTWSQTTATRS